MTHPAAAPQHQGSAARNLVPGKYRGVAMAQVDCALTEVSLREYFLGREVYRRTRFVVAWNGPDIAILAVGKDTGVPLFAPVTVVRLLAAPAECAYVVAPDVDTAVPSALASTAVSEAPAVRAVVVQGRYSHVNFIIGPDPLRVTVREVSPPDPPKLFEQAQRVLDTAEALPPILLVPDVVQLTDLAALAPSARYLVPCRGSGFEPADADTAYLDERPSPQPWTLIGCERSQQIHQWFYGQRAKQVDICPRNRIALTGPLLTKCCLFEDEIAVDENGQVTVPWGASLTQIAEALTVLAQTWEPTWEPV